MRFTRPLRAVAGAIATLLSLMLAFDGIAQQGVEEPPDARRSSDAPADPPDADGGAGPRSHTEPVVYNPPRRGSPTGRVAGATRSAPAFPAPLVLAPDHVAHTLSASPSLFWHLDGTPPEDARIVLALAPATDDADAPAPDAGSDAGSPDDAARLEVDLPLPARPGIQRIDLADHDVELPLGVVIAWSVSLVPDTGHPADAATSTGYLRRVAVAGGSPPSSAGAYAEAGLWYDALTSLADAIAADGADAELREARNSLLRQADLDPALE